jgi:hypothetical protein
MDVLFLDTLFGKLWHISVIASGQRDSLTLTLQNVPVLCPALFLTQGKAVFINNI